MAAHSVLADAFSKVPKEMTNAIRAGMEVPDLKLRTLSGFTRHLIQSRGRPSVDDAQAFLAAGYSEKQILDVILAIGVKTFSNYTNHVFATPVDAAFQPRRWAPQILN